MLNTSYHLHELCLFTLGRNLKQMVWCSSHRNAQVRLWLVRPSRHLQNLIHLCKQTISHINVTESPAIITSIFD